MGPVARPAGRFVKLRAMSAGEVAHRLSYGAYTAFERVAQSRGFLARPDRLETALDPQIRRRSDWADLLVARPGTRAFFGLGGDPSELRRVFQRRFGDELAKSRQIADQVSRHEIGFFGEIFRLGPEINWHADPVTGAEWPRRYHRDVLGGSGACGDVKHVWELNRHQFFIDLAKVAFLDESDAPATELHALLDSWFRLVPCGVGAAWACALEPAFRAWSWLWAYHMVLAAGLLSPSMHLSWLTGFLDHGRFLHRHLERYTSPYNHLIGEASALFALGLLFPEFEESRRWVHHGRGVLETTLGSQFHEDGGSVEQSTFYHHATLGFYLLSALLGRQNGEELGQPVWHAIERGIDFSMALVQPDGRLPSIGGADDGKPIRLEHLPFWDFRPYYAIGAVLFGRGDFKTAAGRFWEDALWMLGPRALDTFDALPPAQPAAIRLLPHSGYSVFRSGWSVDADYVCFDCGPQAGGLRKDDVPSAAHGHADCLSIIAALGGHAVLVDPGFYCYNGPTDWEVHFRKTAAHNTISIDGRDQARHIAKMAWARTYTPSLEAVSAEGALGWARGSHDGYADSGCGIVHRRSVWLREGGYVVILDELTGTPGRVARANFQFAPGDLQLDGTDAAVFDDRFEFGWACSAPVEAEIVRDGDSPSSGWIAPSLGVRTRAPRLLLEFPIEQARVVLFVILADRQRSATRGLRRVHFQSVSEAQDPTALGARIEGQGWTDYVVTTAGGRTVRWEAIESDAPVAISRVAGDGTAVAHGMGGFVRPFRQGPAADLPSSAALSGATRR